MLKKRLQINTLLIALLLLGVVSTANASSTLAPIAQNAQSGSDAPTTEDALAQTVIPARDLADLAVRLGGVAEIPPAPTAPTQIYQPDDVDTFFVHGDNEVITVEAQMVYANDVVYMWIEQGYSADATLVQEVADRFAQDIYPSVRSVFGSESTPGVDGDPRIHILNSAQLGSGVAGYFYSLHEYPVEAIAVSNAREMFFAAIGVLQNNPEFYLSLLAHEFEHMIHFAVDANEESWIDEGLAELAAYEAGFGISNFASSFISVPQVQLNNWPDSNTGPIYGGAFLFTKYLREQFGIDYIQALVAHPANGMEGVERVFAEQERIDPRTGTFFSAEDVFRDWTIANLVNDNGVGDERFGYADPDLQGLQVSVNNVLTIPGNVASSINQWGTQYFRILPGNAAGGSLTVDFKGSEQVRLLPVNAYSGNNAFWSNRANLSNPRLTRNVDLSGVDSATLNFWTWYDIEDGWDYAYLVVSDDGGQSWDLIQTDRTTTRNPNGTGYGNSYTGSSNGWVQESVDLTPYAGQEVLVRWEYVTDDAFLLNGMLIDDVSIPEIGYFDDFEGAAPGWYAEGWLRTNNILQQHFSVTLIERTQSGEVRVLPLLSAGQGTELQQSVEISADVSELTLAVSAYAPITVQPAGFDLQLSAE
jgi:immune inhibitor A